MYLFVLLLVFVPSLSIQHGCEKHKSYHQRHTHYHVRSQENDRAFDRLALDYYNADRKVLRLCSANDKHLAETYLSSFYRLTVSLPEFSAEDIKVKIRHRVIFVQAAKDNVKIFSEVKILPDIVNMADPSWTFQDGRLEILMTYKWALGTEAVDTCNVSTNTAVLDVPMSIMDIDARFGEDDTTALPLSNAAY